MVVVVFIGWMLSSGRRPLADVDTSSHEVSISSINDRSNASKDAGIPVARGRGIHNVGNRDSRVGFPMVRPSGGPHGQRAEGGRS